MSSTNVLKLVESNEAAQDHSDSDIKDWEFI